MPEESFLIGLSQLALVFSGFVAVFMVFVRGDGRFSPADSLLVTSMVLTGFGLIFAAMVPMAFHHLGYPEADVWRYSAVFAALSQFIGIVFIGSRHLRLDQAGHNEVGILHSLLTWGLSLTGFGAIVAVALGYGLGGLYIVGCLLLLAVSAINFITMALQKLF